MLLSDANHRSETAVNFSVLEQAAAAITESAAEGAFDEIPDEVLQNLMAALVKIYASRVDAGQRPNPLPPQNEISATAILVMTSALLKASNLEIFELGMWQSWSATR